MKKENDRKVVKGELTTIGESVVISIQRSDKGEPVTFIYPSNTPSAEIVQDSTTESHIHLAPQEIEVVTDTIERSKWLGAGFQVSFGSPQWGSLKFTKLPQKEVRTIKKAKYRKIEK